MIKTLEAMDVTLPTVREINRDPVVNSTGIFRVRDLFSRAHFYCEMVSKRQEISAFMLQAGRVMQDRDLHRGDSTRSFFSPKNAPLRSYEECRMLPKAISYDR